MSVETDDLNQTDDLKIENWPKFDYLFALSRNFCYSNPFLYFFSSNFDPNKGLLKSPFFVKYYLGFSFDCIEMDWNSKNLYSKQLNSPKNHHCSPPKPQ